MLIEDRKYVCPKWAEILLRKRPPLLDKGGGSVVDSLDGLKNNQLLNAIASDCKLDNIIYRAVHCGQPIMAICQWEEESNG